MQNSGREILLTWRIENFSMCALPEDRCMSTTFETNLWNTSRLSLYIYPRGWKNSQYISCYATVNKTELENTTLEYAITIGSSDVSSVNPERMQWDLKQGNIFGIQNLVSREEVFKKKEVFLPNDTLTIQFRMWIINEVIAPFTPLDMFLETESVLAVGMINEFKRFFRITRHSAKTRIIIQRKSLLWPIQMIHAQGKDMPLPQSFALDDAISFEMTFFAGVPKDPCATHLKIRVKDSSDESNTFVKCKLTVLNLMRNLVLLTEGQHLFNSQNKDDVWNLSLSHEQTELSEILNSKNKIFYLSCELQYCRDGDVRRIAESNDLSMPFANCLNMHSSSTLVNDFKDLYETGELSDITLCVGERHFKAHKSILSTRSPVFRKMFRSNMKEKKTGFVDITDLDPDTLNRLLVFLYSDQLGDLEPESAASLYLAADKYEVLSLKERCSVFFLSVLSVSNVCLILKLADMHEDGKLLESAKWFIFKNSNEVFVSDEWKTLMESNLKLCSSVMYQMLTDCTK